MMFPQRKIIRLPGYDYSAGGCYFCTVCVHKMHRHKNLFGRVEAGGMSLNRFGKLVEKCWADSPAHRSRLVLDESMVMPNHFHALFWLDGPLQTEAAQGSFGPRTPQSLSSVMAAFKSDVSREIGLLRGEKTVVWQSRFHDRIVRSEQELLAIRRYIQLNPAQWTNDRCHPDHPDFERVWQDLSPDPDSYL